MQFLRKLKYLVFVVLFLAVLIPAETGNAQTPPKCRDAGSITAIEQCGLRVKEEVEQCQQSSTNPDTVERCIQQARGETTAGAGSDITSGSNLEADCKDDTNNNGTALDKDDCAIVGYVITFTNVLSALVGIVIVIMIAVGGLQYSAARDDPQAVSAAKTRIQNAITALVFYLFAFAFLQWLIPGGIF